MSARFRAQNNLYGLGFDPHENAPEFRRSSTALALGTSGDAVKRNVIRMDAVFKQGGGATTGCVARVALGQLLVCGPDVV